MKKKILFTLSLFLFVVGSVVYLVMQKDFGMNSTDSFAEAEKVNQLAASQEKATQESKKYGKIEDAPKLEDDSKDEVKGEEERRLERKKREDVDSITQSSNESSSTEASLEKAIRENKQAEGKDEEMTNQGTVLNTLGNAYEIQDNTFVDKWGVVIKLDRLPEELRNAKGYTVAIGDKSYELSLNKYNSNVFNTQVSSIEHTKAEIEKAILTAK